MLRPSGLSRRAVVMLLIVSLAAILVGAALLTRHPGNAAGPNVGDTTSAPMQDASGSTAETSASVVGSSTIVGKDHTQQRVAPAGSANASRPATAGAELTTVTVPPPKTLAMIATDNATSGSQYTVELRVYGYGPVSGTIKTAVALVTKSTPVGQVEKPFSFTGRNVLIRLDPSAAEAITRGGAYSGVITLRKSGDSLVPWFGDVDDGR